MTVALETEITPEKIVGVILENLTPYQLESLCRKIYKNNITNGDNYQPFGYDNRTLKITKPNELTAYLFVLDEYNKRDK